MKFAAPTALHVLVEAYFFTVIPDVVKYATYGIVPTITIDVSLTGNEEISSYAPFMSGDHVKKFVDFTEAAFIVIAAGLENDT